MKAAKKTNIKLATTSARSWYGPTSVTLALAAARVEGAVAVQSRLLAL
jgi:hypothetical protein